MGWGGGGGLPPKNGSQPAPAKPNADNIDNNVESNNGVQSLPLNAVSNDQEPLHGDWLVVKRKNRGKNVLKKT